MEQVGQTMLKVDINICLEYLVIRKLLAAEVVHHSVPQAPYIVLLKCILIIPLYLANPTVLIDSSTHS